MNYFLSNIANPFYQIVNPPRVRNFVHFVQNKDSWNMLVPAEKFQDGFIDAFSDESIRHILGMKQNVNVISEVNVTLSNL